MRFETDQRSHLRDVQKFYAVLDQLTSDIGGSRQIANCDGYQAWPKRGVYFFFESGEQRDDSRTRPRVVRVGTHALNNGSKSTLWGRLGQHRGTRDGKGGNHRGSIFRLLVGLALSERQRDLKCSSWSVGNNAPTEVKERERNLEEAVSGIIGKMSIVWLPVDDEPSKDSLRGYVERNAIALLSNFSAPVINAPSSTWLGHFCPRDRVQRSGLWNNNHVEETYDPYFIDSFERLASVARSQSAATTVIGISSDLIRSAHTYGGAKVENMQVKPITVQAASITKVRTSSDFDSTLFVIPCSGTKTSRPVSELSNLSILDDLPDELALRLSKARAAIATEALLDDRFLMPAWQRYAGQLYKSGAPAFQQAIQSGQVRHMLILSGGYGVVKAKEAIGDYKRRLSLGDWPRGLLQSVIAAYAKRHRIHSAKLFASGSTDYAKLLRQVSWRNAGVTSALLYTPERSTGAMIKAHRALGERIKYVLSEQFHEPWRSSDGLLMDVEDLSATQAI
jgi:hypothetical protein